MTWEFALGLYGTFLSTALALWQWRKSRRTISIHTVPAISPSPDMEGKWIRVSIKNRGFETIHIRHAFIGTGLQRPDLGLLGYKGVLKHRTWTRRWWLLGTGLPETAVADPSIPHSLDPGRNVVIWLPWEKVASLMEGANRGVVRVVVQDELDRTFLSPKLPRW